MNHKQVNSPLTSGPADRVGAISVDDLVRAYQTQHGLDVSIYLPSVRELEIYRCRDSGLEFFHPPGLEGPPSFYEALYGASDADWAYRDAKWEFEVGAKMIAAAESVLDIGCGGGAFLERLDGQTSSRTGLEPNPMGRRACGRKGVQVFDQTIGQHSESHPEHYDAVTAFQVLEHVGDPGAFLRGCVDTLKPGGILLISVPNSDSFLNRCKLLPLNSPPHHVTLWRRRSLEAIPSHFPLDLRWVEKEPLQDTNLGWYQSTMEFRYLPRSRLLRSAYYRLGFSKAVRRFLEENCDTIDGHTIVAKFRKRS